MKAYVKPELFYERYELSQHIADCTFERNLYNDSCRKFVGEAGSGLDGMTVFTTADGCDWTEDQIEGFCYTTGALGKNTFVS